MTQLSTINPPDPAGGAGSSKDRGDPPSILLIAAWFGLTAGLFELASLVVRVRVFEKGFFLRSRHFVWMVPVSVLSIFMTCGVVLALIGRVGWRPSPRVVLFGFLCLACAGEFLLVPGLHLVTCALLSIGIALRTAPWIDRRITGFRRLIRATLPISAVILTGLVAVAIARDPGYRPVATDRTPASTVPGQAPNVLLIVMDTVRADRLSLHGYGRETSPNLNRLARQGVWFRQARSTASWTLPSHSSLFTGRWPHELQAERLGWLDGRHVTLAEFLASRGYSTGGFVANTFFCGHESGLARGFETYRDYPVNPVEILRASSLGWFLSRTVDRARERILWAMTAEGPARIGLDFTRKSAADVNREFLDWLDRRREGPFFAFLNYFDAHDPYLPPDRPARPFGIAPRSRQQFAMLRDWQKLDRRALDPASRSLASDAYDDCIASLDRDLGRLFDELRRRRLLEDTLLILTADHGEQFGEHGSFGHGMSLYEPEVHVPLLVVYPRRVPGGATVDEPVSLRDVPATVAELIGGSVASPFPGTPLSRRWGRSPSEGPDRPDAPLSELEAPIEAPPDRSGSHGSRGPSQALLVGRNTYLHYGDGSEELYDLEHDPGESRNLGGSDGSAPLVAGCRSILRRILVGSE